jgi:hypothetical protein
MGIEIKKRDCTIHRRIGSAAQQAQQTAAVGKSSYRPTRVRYRTTVAGRCTHTHTSPLMAEKSLSHCLPPTGKGVKKWMGRGARMTICFVSDIIVPPIFRWQSSTLACSKWIEKCIYLPIKDLLISNMNLGSLWTVCFSLIRMNCTL